MSVVRSNNSVAFLGSVAEEHSVATADCIGLYFSAHWCPPCRGFTPQLAKIYNSLKAQGKKFEVVFVSSDQDQSGFDEYFNEMPWKAVPYSDRSLKDTLSSKYGVSGIPALILLDNKGDVISKSGRNVVVSDPSGGWIPSSSTSASSQVQRRSSAQSRDWKDIAGETPSWPVPAAVEISHVNTEEFASYVGVYFRTSAAFNIDIYVKRDASNGLYYYDHAEYPGWRTTGSVGLTDPGSAADPSSSGLGSGSQYPNSCGGANKWRGDGSHYNATGASDWTMKFYYSDAEAQAADSGLSAPLTGDLQRVDTEFRQLSSFLESVGAAEFEGAFREELGITELEDLKFVEQSDLEDIGMSRIKGRRVLKEIEGL